MVQYDAKLEALRSEHQGRQTVISQDDILNLSISLNTVQTVDEFIASL
jgi:hypothetical protein